MTRVRFILAVLMASHHLKSYAHAYQQGSGNNGLSVCVFFTYHRLLGETVSTAKTTQHFLWFIQLLKLQCTSCVAVFALTTCLMIYFQTELPRRDESRYTVCRFVRPLLLNVSYV